MLLTREAYHRTRRRSRRLGAAIAGETHTHCSVQSEGVHRLDHPPLPAALPRPSCPTNRTASTPLGPSWLHCGPPGLRAMTCTTTWSPCVQAHMPRYPNTHTPRHPDTQTPISPDTQTQTPRYAHSQIPTHPHPQTPIPPSPQTSRDPDTQGPRHPHPQTPSHPQGPELGRWGPGLDNNTVRVGLSKEGKHL